MKNDAIVKIKCKCPYLRNPNFVRGMPPDECYLPPTEMEADVIALYLSSGKMRIRFTDPNGFSGKPEVKTFDVAIDPFFEQFEIRAKD